MPEFTVRDRVIIWFVPNSKVIVTVAWVTPACPCLYIMSWYFSILGSLFDGQSTKHIASRMFDFPLPLSPVTELNVGDSSASLTVFG